MTQTGDETSHDAAAEPVADAATHRALAVSLFNNVWPLMERSGRSPDENDEMLHMAHASRYHWALVGTAANLARGEWLCSRVYAVLGRAEPSLYHAGRMLELCTEHGIGDWDLAFGYEALARAHAVAGNAVAAREATVHALRAAEEITHDHDRDLLLSDLETIPGQPRFW